MRVLKACSPGTAGSDLAFQAAIDLDPASSDHLRKMGALLLPRWGGGYRRPEIAACHAADTNGTLWGEGAYGWLYMDALALDPLAHALLDAERFSRTIRHILQTDSSQHMANVLAGQLGIHLCGECDILPAPIRVAMLTILRLVVTDHLREIHPMIWAQTCTAKQPAFPELGAPYLSRRGAALAVRFLSDLFRPQIEAGNSILFTEDALIICPKG